MGITILSIAIVVLLLLLLLRPVREATKRGAEGVVELCNYALDRTVRKNENKEKIVKLFGERSEINNSDIRDTLGLSSRSVVRYMTELENEGKVEQIGHTGRGVVYKLKT